jgi:uncharacterized protein (DUF305 family)
MLLAVCLGGACRTAGPAPAPAGAPPSPASQSGAPPIIQPGAPGQASREIAVERAVDLSKVGHTPADVRFMQGMIGHHAQALDMSALVPARTSREDMKLLARRIEISQLDEIKMMQEWLKARGQTIPDEHAHHAHDYKPMPGMLSAEDMSRLAAAKGVEFDRLFLAGMIKHHAGALMMVEDLFSNPAAGQDSEINAFASDVEADQRMEIERMAALLKELQK